MKGGPATRASSLLVLVVAALTVAACTGGSTPPPTAAVTPAPSQSVAAPTAVATPSAVAASAGSPTAPALPPAASLAAEGGDPVVGQLGSFTWGDGGSDSPWLPGAPIAVGAGEPLSVTLADETAVATWTAVRAPAASTSGAGATAAGEGSGAIGFAVAEPGRWTVAVTIGFVRGGSATYYWRLDVT